MEAIGEDGSLSLVQTRQIGEVLAGYTYVREGDVTIAKITPCFENGKGAVMRGLQNHVGFGTTELIVMRPQSSLTTSEYLYRVVSSEPFRVLGESSMYGAGGQKRVPDDFVRNFKIAWPPYKEQVEIQAFLDHETARIDTLVEEQQRLIELLKEKRQAVISHAVTKGLDPDVPMKDSGVEWLGEVPEHWRVQSINQATQKITNGYVGPTRDILVDTGIPYVQATHIKNGVINFDGKYFVTPEWSNKMRKSILQEGDVLIVQTGAGTGDVAVVSANEEGYNCHALIILQPVSEKLAGEYLAKFLQSHVGNSVLFSLRTGGMHPHLNCGEVKFIKMPVPPHGEQIKISAYISSISSVIDGLTAESMKAIKFLRERRSAVISAAVTGKIDVRGWQAAREADPSEMLKAAEERATYG
jgi:type I restriction enzyme S subunit